MSHMQPNISLKGTRMHQYNKNVSTKRYFMCVGDSLGFLFSKEKSPDSLKLQ